MLECEIDAVFQKYPDVIYGYANPIYSKYGKDYCTTLVIAVPYDQRFTLHNYSEAEFEESIIRAEKIMNDLRNELIIILNNRDIKYWVPPIAQEDEKSLLAPFSFKYAALQAGIGWLGKNDLIITEKYGTQQRLGTILFDYEVNNYGSILKNQCPKECNLCKDICPYHAIKGVQWHSEIKREEMIDYLLCNRQRSKFIERLGRKHACGLCLIVCPYNQNFTK